MIPDHIVDDIRKEDDDIKSDMMNYRGDTENSEPSEPLPDNEKEEINDEIKEILNSNEYSPRPEEVVDERMNSRIVDLEDDIKLRKYYQMLATSYFQKPSMIGAKRLKEASALPEAVVYDSNRFKFDF